MRNIMLEYIGEEPKILNELLVSNEIENVIYQAFNSIHSIVFIAHGSSYNATLTVMHALRQMTGMRVRVLLPSFVLWNTLSLGDPRTTIIIAVSQTGISSGVLETVARAKAEGYRTLSLSENNSTILANLCDYSISLQCGTENSNAKTKGFVCTQVALLKMGFALAKKIELIPVEIIEEYFNELKGMIDQIKDTMAAVEDWIYSSHFFENIDHMFFLGESINYGTACEGQLKLMETLCVPALASDYVEFTHGMHRCLKPESHIVLINGREQSFQQKVELFDYVKQLGANVLMLDSSGLFNYEARVISIPLFKNLQSFLLHTIAIHTLAAYTPFLLNRNPNAFANDDLASLMKTRILQ